MFLNAYKKQVFLCLILSIVGITAVAREDNNRSYRIRRGAPNQSGYRPAAVASQRPLVRNQTQWQGNAHGQSYNNHQQQHNNRTQYNQPSYQPALVQPQQPIYSHGAFNQTRPSWQQAQIGNNAQNPAYGQQGNFNRTRPSWQQAQIGNHAQYPVYGQHGNFNGSRPSWQQAQIGNNAQYPVYGQQGNFNGSQPSWQQPSAPQLPSYPPQASNSNLYPKLPALNPSAIGNSVPQTPQNWHSGGLGVLSYPLPSGNKNSPTYQSQRYPHGNIIN